MEALEVNSICATYDSSLRQCFAMSLHRRSCCSSLGTSQPASGTTLMRMSLAQITQAAQVIVRARCIGNSTRWDAGEIWTFTSFDVEETWSGSAPAQISVRLLGGSVGNLTSTVSGVPRFSPGEEVVLFLESTAARRLFHCELGAGHLPDSPRRSHGRRSRRAGHRRFPRFRSGHAPLRDYRDSQSSDRGRFDRASTPQCVAK